MNANKKFHLKNTASFYYMCKGKDDSIDAPIIESTMYIPIATNEHAKPAIAIPVPALFVPKETAPNMIDIIPHGKHIPGIQKNTKHTIPNTIDAIANPLDSFVVFVF